MTYLCDSLWKTGKKIIVMIENHDYVNECGKASNTSKVRNAEIFNLQWQNN